MKNKEINFRSQNYKYSILIGKNTLNQLPNKLKIICPKTKNIALIIDKKVPLKFKKTLKNKLKNYNLLFLSFSASEKNKSLNIVNYFLKVLLAKNFNRSDSIIAVGGGITGDVAGFVASIFKRGINFINIPTTLLAQVDSAVGGKTGINSFFGKNLIGSFYQPKLVISDTSFIYSLSRKEMICGFAEILKHAIIKDKNFFNWLKKNTKLILSKDTKTLTQAIKKSCQIKIFFVTRDINENKLRMVLNFGHTFAHAIEVKNNYSKNTTHGEAVLTGMILAIKLSILKNICKKNTLNEVMKLYADNNLNYTLKNISSYNWIKSLIPFLKNDKKNNDEKINFLLLKKIGQTDKPNKFKISAKDLLKYCKTISQY